ncbi:MAG: redox-regulated ATPase YchF, partial [Anaerolineae bacterium]
AGIIGLPNVGKSTAFNALTRAQKAQVANYPFCTIQPNRAVVPLPDPRLEKLAQLAGVDNIIHATIEFVDIAGLVRGASRGEGLGNQFLGHIRDTDAIVHLVRCFEDDNVVHVTPTLNPRDDIETVNLELALADLQQLERKLEKLSRQVKGDKTLQPTLDVARALRDHLNDGRPVSTYPARDSSTFEQFMAEMRFLTAKPVIYAANVDEDGLAADNAHVRAVREFAAERGAAVVKLCAKFEAELADMTGDERREFLELAGATESGLDQIVSRSFALLKLINFFTMNEREVRAWTVPQGTPAPNAAGTIHTDFERGFIRAEVIPFPVFAGHGSSAAARAAGAMRLEGKEYIVQDGDVIYFRFNV